MMLISRATATIDSSIFGKGSEPFDVILRLESHYQEDVLIRIPGPTAQKLSEDLRRLFTQSH